VILRPLDRYALKEFVKIFIATALGFPLLVTVFDLTDHIDTYLNRNLPQADIALAYLYWIPDNMSMVLPAATLFAVVFSIGGFTRHSEITAAKASGISFHRLTVPLFFGAVIAALLALGMSEIAPKANRRRAELLQEVKYTSGSERFNFAYAAEHGRVYKIATLNSDRGTLNGLEIERKGRDGDNRYPTVFTSSDVGFYKAATGWTFRSGTMHVLSAGTRDVVFQFDSLRDRLFTEAPLQMMGSATAPQEMRYQELGKYIAALERSGGNANELRVERALKIAIPVTCLIIAFFGAPLATSTQRGGTAWGVAVALATTVTFLVVIQLTKAIGQKGIIPPEIAAWTPNVLFGVTALVLLARVRT